MKTTSQNMLWLIPEFEKFVAASKKGRRIKYPGRKLSPGTIGQYECVRKLLAEFELRQQTTYRIVVLKKLSAALLKNEERYWRRFLTAFTLFLYQQKCCYDNYVSSVYKTLKAFFTYLVEDKGHYIGNFYKRFKTPQQVFVPLVLEPTKLQMLITDTAFEASLPPHLKRTKDLFVFGCTVALRYSDLMRLRKTHLIHSPEGKYLQLYTQKTATLVKLPLPDYLLAIVEKYKRLRGQFLLPRLSSTNLNLQIKELCRRAGWNYTVPKVRYRMGKPMELKNSSGSSLAFYEQVTTHTMRRTAITTLLIMGVPELVVRRISGHSAHSREFYRYVVIAQDYLNQQVLAAYKKLLTGS